MTPGERGLLSPNPGKRAAERFYLIWFPITLPFQMLVMHNLSFTHTNDAILVTQAVVMGGVAWFGPLFFRAAEDRDKPFHRVYGFKFGCFLAVWAMVGGYLGTDPWYEVLSGHFAFNTAWNPNGVPFFMLPMTIAVFGFYSAVLGIGFRLGWRWYLAHANRRLVPPLVGDRLVLIVPLAVLMPLVETLFYTSDYYCYDPGPGKWFLNVLVYGAWQGSALLFYPRLDERPGDDMGLRRFVVDGFAAVGILLFVNQLTTDVLAPHFTEVRPGVRFVDDWSTGNCLGPRPGS